jgi:hypothetical protein
MLPALASALRSRGIVRWCQGEADAARMDFMSALALDRSIRYPYDEAKTLYWLGLLEASVGKESQAHALLAEGWHILSRLGEQPYFERIQRAIAGLEIKDIRAESRQVIFTTNEPAAMPSPRPIGDCREP